MGNMTIGRLAKEAGVNIETIRYYERRGLIQRPPRRESGYRQYTRETLARLRFIKRAKLLGFSLREIQEILSLRLAPETTCSDVRIRVERKIADIDERIQALQEMKKALTTLARQCSGDAPAGECPIIEALDSTEHEYNDSR